MPAVFTISDYMTVAPHAIEPHEPLAAAEERMQKLKVWHLPVRMGGKPVGIISDRDLQMVKALRTVDMRSTKIADIMTPDPYCVAPDAPLSEVCAAMLKDKYGSALVVDAGGRLVGIFTTSDALRALQKLV